MLIILFVCYFLIKLLLYLLAKLKIKIFDFESLSRNEIEPMSVDLHHEQIVADLKTKIFQLENEVIFLSDF